MLLGVHWDPQGYLQRQYFSICLLEFWMTRQGGTAEDIILSCRNVWKVYGKDPKRFFSSESNSEYETKLLSQRIVASGNIVANADVSFDVHTGEIFVIMGLSGSGKSTIVRCLSRLIEPTFGEIYLDGEDLLKKSEKELIEIRRHKMGMVFQSFGLMPHLNVIDNIAFPLKLQGLKEDERFERAARVIELVGLAGRENNFPKELSGGQQQRVGIARSLAVEPDVWFLDEPFSALDPLIRKQMQNEFLRIQSVQKKSVVFITHDFQEALRIADRMAIMRDGSIVQIGTPVDLILNPADSYIREFTKDVPWESVLNASDIIDKEIPIVKGATEILDSTPVAKLLTILVKEKTGVIVVDQEGKKLGMANAHSFVAALATSEVKENKTKI